MNKNKSFAKNCSLPKRLLTKWSLLGSLLFCGVYAPLPEDVALANEPVSEDERFANFEIRVIRPRFFSKRNRFELGIEATVVTNQTFIYTYLLSGLLTYHISETLGVELSGASGSSVDKQDKEVLEDDFNIKTQIIRTKTMFSGSVLWTPIYGKYQLASGRLIYFDTYLAAGAGTSGVEYKYDHCLAKPDEADTIPEERVVQYGTFSVGIGQRFFLNKNYSLKWDLRDHLFNVGSKDGACSPESEEDQKSMHQNITMQFGFSRFF